MYSILRTIIFKTINSICKIFLEIFVFDKQIRRILKGKLAKLYLKKYVKKADKIVNKSKTEKKEKPKIIWQYWEQGIEKAPDIVKECIKSVEKYKNGCEHKIIDINSLKEYVEIPQFIYDLKEKGIINLANFSDIVRTFLLAQYGGTWIDSTVLLTDDLADYIIKSDLFVFQNYLRTDLDGLNIASYFISSSPNNAFMLKLKQFFIEYWKENLFANNYFFYLHAFTMLTVLNKQNTEEFSKVPYFSFIPVQHFQKELMNQYSKERWEQIKSMTPVHKLSYKKDVYNKQNKNMENTFYEKLIKGELI